MSMRILASAVAAACAVSGGRVGAGIEEPAAVLRRRLATDWNNMPMLKCHITPWSSFQMWGFFDEPMTLGEPGIYTIFQSLIKDFRVQARIEHRLSPCHSDYDSVDQFKATAYAMYGEWLCGMKYEIFADPPMLKVTHENGMTVKYEGYDAIEASVAELSDLGAECPKLTYWKNGNAINDGNGERYNFQLDNRDNGHPYRMTFSFKHQSDVGLNQKGVEFRLQIWDHQQEYLSQDTGSCTMREGYTEPVAPGLIHFSEEFGPDSGVCTEAPTLAPTSAECGKPGKVGKRDAEKVRGIQEKLGGSKLAESACVCKEACASIGGTEFLWKTKSGRCRCFKGATKITYNSKKGKRVAGPIEGSTAEIIVKE